MYRKRSSQVLTEEMSNELKFLYQVEEEDETKLLSDDLRFLSSVQQVIKYEIIIAFNGAFIHLFGELEYLASGRIHDSLI